MTEQTVVDLGAKTLWVAIQVATPALLTTLVVGLLVSVLQAATQINEQTMSFIPKVLAMTAAMVFAGPWIVQTMMSFTLNLFHSIPEFIR